ncbi:MAG: phage tail protein [Cyanobacteria bacterium 13_1_40CM_2_61_4]|nr:MAG: phage tail protein [Cyanobacteria bacterium 13_1_40CM_2_61_4]
MAVGDRKDPFRSYNFLVEIDGITRAGFRECSGLDSTQDPVEYREGNEPPTARKLPGLVKHSNISLKRGVTDDAQLWEWRKQAIDGKVQRKNGSIILLDESGAEKIRWNFREGWPTKWTGPSFNATGNEVAIETLEIAHEGVLKA